MTEHSPTSGFVMNQVMLRIRDPKPSLAFYQDVLGLRLLRRFDFPEMKFTLYFMGYADDAAFGADGQVSLECLTAQPGLIELTHNYGTESDPEFAGYHNGNSDPRGFGHIGFTVPDVTAACDRFAALGVEFVKRPDQGSMKEIAFIKDPDGYWIEILSARSLRPFATPRA